MFRVVFLVALWLTCLSLAQAQTFNGRPDVKAYIERISREQGFDPQELARILGQAQRQAEILTAIARPAEAKPWYQYRALFLTSQRIEQGVAFWRANETLLQRAAETFQVPAQIIVAILGVETRYGAMQGRYRVLDALATLGFDYPPRADFFRSELTQFLLLTRDEHLVAHDALGSYAGAMGMAQFIPSSYRRLAIDFDGDGQRNLWHPADAIGSIANYFHKNGWRAGEPVAFKLRAKGILTPEPDNRNLQLSKTVWDFKRADLLPRQVKVPDDESAGLIELAQADGPEYWMALHNFQVITKYNRSILYAMAVYQLSEEINKAHALAA